ncbi:nuclear transport factor 2 family protein [Spartinivicinus ruber]|uniref:nuclear transport factor 2 family protein n=1 Tax=Spartinivicinus ruber TaxID=2683272 RepID=UPI0013D0BF91|nr:nuclear transport factor 2 family protein [Spartinivicinus ruber]
MSASEHLNTYLEGWGKGDAELILKATATDYTLDDPNHGMVSKSEFMEYFEELKKVVASLCDGQLPNPLVEASEVLTKEEGSIFTAWCWWGIPGTPIKGSGLIKVGANGVYSEVLTYYTKLSG